MHNYGRIFVKVGVIAGALRPSLIIFPTGDLHGKYVARHQPAAIAAMEGLSQTETGAGIVLMGQPNEETGQIDNPLVVNNVLSFLIYGTTKAEVTASIRFRTISGPRRCRCSSTPTTSWPGSEHISSCHDCRCVSALARTTLHRALDAVGSCSSAFRCPTLPTPPAG